MGPFNCANWYHSRVIPLESGARAAAGTASNLITQPHLSPLGLHPPHHPQISKCTRRPLIKLPTAWQPPLIRSRAGLHGNSALQEQKGQSGWRVGLGGGRAVHLHGVHTSGKQPSGVRSIVALPAQHPCPCWSTHLFRFFASPLYFPDPALPLAFLLKQPVPASYLQYPPGSLGDDQT